MATTNYLLTKTQNSSGECQIVLRTYVSLDFRQRARRTFIGNIYKQVKDSNLIGSLSGHKEGSKAFAGYSAIDDEMNKELIGFLY